MTHGSPCGSFLTQWRPHYQFFGKSSGNIITKDLNTNQKPSILTPIDLFWAFFLKFSKKLINFFKSSISPQLRVPEERTIARLKGLILGFHFGQMSPCRRAPLPSEF